MAVVSWWHIVIYSREEKNGSSPRKWSWRNSESTWNTHSPVHELLLSALCAAVCVCVCVIYMRTIVCVCVCVCVWERERERDRETDRQTDRQRQRFLTSWWHSAVQKLCLPLQNTKRYQRFRLQNLRPSEYSFVYFTYCQEFFFCFCCFLRLIKN